MHIRTFTLAALALFSMSAPAHSIRFAGTWEGGARYQLIQDAGQTADTHATTRFIFHIGPHGEITGESQNNGCRFLGTARPDGAEPSLTLNITLSDCRLAEYNGNYTGSFIYSTQERFATVSLIMTPVLQGNALLTAEITATLYPL